VRLRERVFTSLVKAFPQRLFGAILMVRRAGVFLPPYCKRVRVDHMKMEDITMLTTKFFALIAATAIPALASAQTVSSDATAQAAQLKSATASVTEFDQYAGGELNPGDREGVIYNGELNPGDREGVIYNQGTRSFDIAGGELNPGDREGAIYNGELNPGDREGVIYNVDHITIDIA